MSQRSTDAHFEIIGRLNGSQGGSMTIDKHSTVTVRPKGERREYSLPLLTVADMVVSRVVKNELASEGRRK